ncbi:hypothetical protein LCGC14_1436940, partial [marine sediment metagenome]
GDQRIARADTFLSNNVGRIGNEFTHAFLCFFLIKEDKQGDRREIGSWYLFCAADLALWAVVLFVFLPWLQVEPRPIIEQLRRYIWPISLCLFLPPIFIIPASRFIDWLLRRFTVRDIRSFHVLLSAWFLPVAFMCGWITIPWLFFVFLAWAVLHSLLSIVRFKVKLALGNVFYVAGALCLLASFVLFMVHNDTPAAN